MPFTPQDLTDIGDLIDQKITAHNADVSTLINKGIQTALNANTDSLNSPDEKLNAVIAKDYDAFAARVMTELGEPVIKVPLAPVHITNAVHSAIQYYQQYHMDGNYDAYVSVVLNDQMIKTGIVPLQDSSIQAVFEVMGYVVDPLNPVRVATGAGVGGMATIMGNTLRWIEYSEMNDLALGHLYRGRGNSYELAASSFVAVQTYFKTIKDIREIPITFDFNRINSEIRLTVPDKAPTGIIAGDMLLIRAVKDIMTGGLATLYNDRWFRDYVIAKCHKKWGQILRQFNGVATVGGGQLSGEALIQDAETELTKLETEMKTSLMEPVGPIYA